MTLRLVVTADDLGIDPRRDAGIILSHARGGISQASLLVNGASAALAADTARGAELPLGLHLNFTEGSPVAETSAVRTLVGQGGQMLGKHGFRAAVASGLVEPAHIRAEALAQVARFAMLVGDRPLHIDGHQHVHVIPQMAELLAPLFMKWGIRSTRIPAQENVAVDEPEARAFYGQVSRDAARARILYRRCGVSSSAAFIGLDLMGHAMSADRLIDVLRALSPSTSVELMCHPGLLASQGDEFNRSPAREHELRVLTSEPLSADLARQGIELVGFDALWRRGALS